VSDTELLATTAGLFPPVETDDDDAVDGSAEESAVETARREAVDWQVAAGLDRVVEGQRGWSAGLVAPLLACSNVDSTVVDEVTNGRPVVTGDLAATGRLAGELRAAREYASTTAAGTEPAIQTVVPGPYTLATRVVDEHVRERAALVDALAEWLAAELRACPSVETTMVLTPGLVETPPPDGLDERASSALDVLADAASGDVLVYPPGGAVTEKTYAYLMDADVAALGVDLCADHERCRYLVNEYGTTDDLVLGIADVTDAERESASGLADRVEWWLANTPAADFDRLYLSLSGPARSLSVRSLTDGLAALAGASTRRST
jgi:5-methyltetrahydropteroyltriglutamate--homocysteine methyltransferase